MIFDFLKKYGQQNFVKEHIVDFRNRFTDDQRKAILISLLIVANSDDDYHNKEQDYFTMISKQLDYPLEEDFIDEFFAMDRMHVHVVLNSLDREQKNWYMLTLFSMIHVDGKPLDVEFEFARPFLEKMGISREQFEETIQQSKLWRKSRPGDFLN